MVHVVDMVPIIGLTQQKLSNMIWERRLDISTRGLAPVDPSRRRPLRDHELRQHRQDAATT